MKFDSPDDCEPPENTDWVVVGDAGSRDPEIAGRARAEIYRRYGPAVYGWARVHFQNIEDAKDLTQSFFEKIISKNWFAQAKREEGKFRNFMLATLSNHAADVRRRASTAKRGGESTHVPIHLEEVLAMAESTSRPADSPASGFQRGWAAALMDIVLANLRRQYEKKGRGKHFEVLAPWLPTSDGKGDYGEACRQLSLTPEAARSAVARFRKDYQTALFSRVAEYLETKDPGLVRAELESLHTGF